MALPIWTEFERNEIENTVRSVLLEEGIHLHADHTERWCIALGEPLGFSFTPLEEALGGLWLKSCRNSRNPCTGAGS